MIRRIAFIVAAALIAALQPVSAQPRSLPRHVTFGAAVAGDPQGVAVTAVIPGSAAEAGGVHVRDVITNFGETPIRSVTDFLTAVHKARAGTTVSVTLVRDGSATTLRVKLHAVPDEHPAGVVTTYETVAVDGTLRRTLISRPAGARGRLPAVLLAGGIGCYSVDTGGNPDDGYARVMQDIARVGFVTERLEKSGVGDSEGRPCHDVGFHDELHAYAVALAALMRDARVDSRHVYLLGHSIGSAVVPRLALEQSVAGVITTESFARDWFDYEMLNLRRQLVLGGDPPDVVDAKLLNKAGCMQHLLYDRMPQDVVDRDAGCKEHDAIYPVGIGYVQDVAALDIIKPWMSVAVPVLVVYGSVDFVIDPEDQQRIVDVVNARHPGNATLAVVNGMTHPLHYAPTQAAYMRDFEKHVPEHYDTDFSRTILAWLCTREHCSAGPPSWGGIPPGPSAVARPE